MDVNNVPLLLETGKGIEKVPYCWALKGKQKYIEKTKWGP